MLDSPGVAVDLPSEAGMGTEWEKEDPLVKDDAQGEAANPTQGAIGVDAGEQKDVSTNVEGALAAVEQSSPLPPLEREQGS